MKRDRDRYATGWAWLDILTDPYWRFTAWWVERKFWLRHPRRDGESWKHVRDRWRPKYQVALKELVEETTEEETK